ncbi:helix-turn-helix domain-containing protein [Rhodococcus hoagii]|nr:helix-turn-helix domain-containing protein [Prescottella equi]
MSDSSDLPRRCRDGISRACASKWVHRYREFGESGLLDRPSIPHRQPLPPQRRSSPGSSACAERMVGPAHRPRTRQ